MADSKRSANFSEAETKLLLKLISKYSNIIECKKTDSATWRDKEEAWKKLTDEFNSIIGSTPRCTKNLKCKYDNVKKSAKKKLAAEKIEIYKTGGGVAKPMNITDTESMVIELVGVSCTGLEAVNDSDDIPVAENKANMSRPTDDSTACSWKNWCPADLRKQVSQPLLVEESEENDLPSNTDERNSIKRKKTSSAKNDLTIDCRKKYSELSSARMELIKLQQESVKQEMAMRKEDCDMKRAEHNLRMDLMKRKSQLEEEKFKMEILSLKNI